MTHPPDHARIVTAARIHTQATTQGNALLLQGAEIRAVGSAEALRSAYPAAEVLDYGDATITPGLTDAHIHITEWAVARREVDLASASSPVHAQQLIRNARHDLARGGWVLGRGWNPHRWGGAYPERGLLDTVLPGQPAAFQSHDMHALWVNTRALELAGIEDATPDPAGGRIVRATDGSAAGTLLENAAQLVIKCIPAPSDSAAEAAVLDAQEQLHRFGITGIHSFPGFHLIEPQPLRILQRLQERDALRLRVLQHIALDQLEEAIHLGLRSGFGNDWIRIGALKMFLDGALGSRTAWMKAPYAGSADCGVQVLSASAFRAAVARAAAAGIASTVHAIGDAAVTLAFDVLTSAEAQAGTLPNRIEHVQCCPPDRLAWASRSGLVCSVQPCHLISDWRAADQHWGHERARTTYAFGALLRHGAILAFGSDAPVEPSDPRLGFYAAAQRQDLDQAPAAGWFPGERIPMAEVLRGYTTGPAIAAGARGRQGLLAPGALADLVVWDQDPLETVGPELLSLTVRATFVAGQSVYTDDA